MKKVFLIPKDGVKVRDPDTGLHMPEEGGERMLNTYYNRRIADGDLIVRDSGSPTAPPAVIENKEGERSKSSKGDK